MKKAYIIVGLGNGDEGKGSTVDFLSQETGSTLTVRFNGGAQCAHHVLREGKPVHAFTQFASSTLHPGRRTFYSQHAYIQPKILVKEAYALSRKFGMDVKELLKSFYVHEDALVTTRYHGITNRLRELSRGKSRHGSCGVGIGETISLFLKEPECALRVRDIKNYDGWGHIVLQDLKNALSKEIKQLIPKLDIHNSDVFNEFEKFKEPTEKLIEEYEQIFKSINIVDDAQARELLASSDTVLFESGQGVLLDETHGFCPYNTWSDTTPRNALSLIEEFGDKDQTEVIKMGVVRTFMTRHGDGPFVSEDAVLTEVLTDPNNRANQWQSKFRHGYFDRVAHKYAVDCCGGIDQLAITHVDQLSFKGVKWQSCTAYNLRDGVSMDKLSVHEDLPRQELLTQELLTATPVYCNSSIALKKEEEIVERIAGDLGSKVGIISRGPLITNKIIL